MSDIMEERPFRIIRKTTFLMQARTAAAMMGPDVDKCPGVPGFVRLTLEGTGDLTGTITVIGKLNGVGQTEDVAADGPIGSTQKWQGTTCKFFDCVTQFDTSGLIDESPVPTLEAVFIGEGGNPLPITCEIEACVLGYLEHPGRQTWPMTTAGKTEQGRPWIAHPDWYDFDPRRGDLYVEQAGDPLADIQVWEVEGNPKHLGPFDSRHWELNVVETNTADLRIIPSI